MSRSYKVTYAPAALDDFRAIYSYIARKLKNPQAARHQADRIRAEIRSLTLMPERYGRADWEPWASMQLHKLSVNNSVVFYQVNTNSQSITVIRSFYGGRNIQEIVNGENE